MNKSPKLLDFFKGICCNRQLSDLESERSTNQQHPPNGTHMLVYTPLHKN